MAFIWKPGGSRCTPVAHAMPRISGWVAAVPIAGRGRRAVPGQAAPDATPRALRFTRYLEPPAARTGRAARSLHSGCTVQVSHTSPHTRVFHIWSGARVLPGASKRECRKKISIHCLGMDFPARFPARCLSYVWNSLPAFALSGSVRANPFLPWGKMCISVGTMWRTPRLRCVHLVPH